MLYAGLMVGLCRAATNIMSDANVFDTIINAAGTLLEGLNTNIAACGMYIFQNLFDFLVPSGSFMAALAMCHIPWGKWFKFIAPLWAVWAVISCVFMVIAVNIGYGPF